MRSVQIPPDPPLRITQLLASLSAEISKGQAVSDRTGPGENSIRAAMCVRMVRAEGATETNNIIPNIGLPELPSLALVRDLRSRACKIRGAHGRVEDAGSGEEMMAKCRCATRPRGRHRGLRVVDVQPGRSSGEWRQLRQ